MGERAREGAESSGQGQKKGNPLLAPPSVVPPFIIKMGCRTCPAFFPGRVQRVCLAVAQNELCEVQTYSLTVIRKWAQRNVVTCSRSKNRCPESRLLLFAHVMLIIITTTTIKIDTVLSTYCIAGSVQRVLHKPICLILKVWLLPYTDEETEVQKTHRLHG